MDLKGRISHLLCSTFRLQAEQDEHDTLTQLNLTFQLTELNT